VHAALALAYFREDIGAMMALVDRALVLNPNYARGWDVSGALRLWAGQPDITIEHADAALRLSPRARVGPSLLIIAAAHFFSRRFDEAVPKLLLAIQDDPSFPTPYRTLAACYAHMGRLDEAREIVARLRAITSVVIPDASFVRNREHRELWLSGLRLAMGDANEPDPPACRDPGRRCGGVFAADGGGRGRDARTPQGAAPRDSSIRKSPNIVAALSRPPATACWWTFRVCSTPCVAALADHGC
jgi:hypothetical protein